MKFQPGISGNPLGAPKRVWVSPLERGREARRTWKRLLKIRDSLILERKTIQTPDGPVEVEVTPSIRDLIRCCEVILNRAVGMPKQQVEVESNTPAIRDREAILAIIATPDAHAHVEKITAAIANRLAHGNAKEPDRALPPPMPVAGSDSGGSDEVIHSRVFRIPKGGE